MKQLLKIKFKWIFAFLLAITINVSGQKQTKKKTETFSVNKDVTIDINTSYTDIVFQTWDKNTVSVEAIMEIEDASKEDANTYFEKWDFKATGDKSRISIRSKSGGNFIFDGGNVVFSDLDLDFDFDFVMPEFIIPDIDLSELTPFIVDIPEIPALALHGFNSIDFDYEAYKKDGDKYLKEWKKKFNKEFDGNFKKELEAWKKEMKEWKEEHKELFEEHRENQKKQAYRIKKEHRKQLDEVRKKADEIRKQVQEAVKEEKSNYDYKFIIDDDDKNLKVKKTIIIKMPKDAKLKMNVRHGEVKLSANYKNIKATLSHTRLLAQTIDGKETSIEASYSPIEIEHWNYGQLKVNYVNDVHLKNVKSLKLTSNSSDVYIGTIIDNSIINGSFGNLEIKKVADSFSSLDIGLENTDVVLVLPKSTFDIYYNGSNSGVKYPEWLTVKVTKNYANKLVKGYNKEKNSDRSITINAKYSDVVMQ